VEADAETGVLLRSTAEAKLNPYDLYALEAAFKLRESIGGTVKVITMGPPQAEAAVREAFAMRADSGVILSDKAFAGADVLATARTLADGIKKSGSFDIIICGKQTTDGDTAQVGPELAEFLDIPHIANVRIILGIEPSNTGHIRVEADMGDYIETFDVLLPCLITVDKGAYVPRLPSYRLMLASASREIPVLTAADLPGESEMYGLKGSPTRVKRIYPPDAKNARFNIGGSSESVANSLLNELRNLKFI